MNAFLKKYQFHLTIFTTLVPFLLLAFFAQPIAEDFGFATQAQKNDFFQLLLNSYQTMNGRYIANIFMYSSPITFNSFLCYKLIPALLIVFTILTSRFFFKQIFTNLTNTTTLLIAIGFTAVYLTGLPIISEGLYWYTGSSIYYIGILFVLLMLGQLTKSIKSKPSISAYTITAVLMFIVCGFNETQTAIITLFITVLMFIHVQKKTTHRVPLIILFLITIAFASLMIFAPGNQFREDMYTQNTHNFIHSVSFSFAQLARFVLDWVISIPLLVASILYLLKLDDLKQKSTLIQQGFYLNKWIALLLLFISILVCVFPPYWFTGILGQHRTLNVGYFAFLLLWFVNLSVWLKESNYHTKITNLVKPYRTHIVILFIMGSLFTDNGFHAIKDVVSGEALQFNQQLYKRHEVLAKTENIKGAKLLLEPISARPTCLFVSDISTDPNYWMNLGYNNYYRLDSVPISIDTKRGD